MNTHNKIRRVLVDFALGELSEQESSEAEMHMAECQQCRTELKELEAVLECAASMRKLSPDERACESAKQELLHFAADEREKQPRPGPGSRPILIWRTIMNGKMTKLGFAAMIIVAAMLSIHLWDRSAPSAYAFIQTVEAMQGKRSFHIQTYFQQRRKDEFWAEFDEEGKLVRYRQKEGKGPDGSLLTLWENGVQSQYFPPPWGVHLMKRVNNTDGGLEGLEEFDPETIVQEIHALVAEGRAVMDIEKPAPYARLKTLRVTRTDGKPLKQVVVVDPATKLVIRVDNYWGEQAQQVLHKGTEVLEYNEAMDPGLFEPNFPEDTIVIDQVTQEVGMAQREMTDEQVAVATLREALDALAEEDYTKAGKLCGGAPRRLLEKFFRQWRPVSAVSIGSPEYVQNVLPVYRVKCTYEVDRDGQVETVSPTFTVRAVSGQPGRWYVAWYVFTEDETNSSDDNR
jgi:hypothetical protein